VTTEYFSHTVLERETNTLGELKGFTIHYADGHADQYHFVPSTVTVGLLQPAFLTARIDPYGHGTQFLYQETNSSVRLLYAVDSDSRTNFLSYTNTAFPTQVTGVQDPFGRNAWLQYNNNGVLTNIVDAIGLFSAFSYDSQGWVTNLTTPYGTTTFEHFVNTDAPPNEFNNANRYHFIRAVRIKDPSGGTNVYMLRQDSSRVYTNSTDFEYFAPLFNDYSEPSWATPDQALGFEILAIYRDSFFWGPRQAASLPVDLTTISATQLYQARMRHWLHDTDSYFISQTLGMQLEPSPDGGQTMGQSVWYAYYGANGMFSGTNSLPALIALMLPDQTPSYTWYRRDIWGHPTNIVQTYSTVFA
jgi:YD repeat-containing protein